MGVEGPHRPDPQRLELLFVVLDLAASATGSAALCRSPGRWSSRTVSLTLTSVAGVPAPVTSVRTAPQERTAS